MSGGDESANPFSLLADETRLGIIEAIGDRSGDGEYACLSYSTIRGALGDHDAGNLNYHLRKLRGRFVEKTDDGYQLTIPGIRVYQAVSSGQFEDERITVAPTPTEYECSDCDEPLYVSYERGRFYGRCRNCDIRTFRYPISPSAFDSDDVPGLVHAACTRIYFDIKLMLTGYCPYCSGRVDHELSEDDRGVGKDDWNVFVNMSCGNCGWYNHTEMGSVVLYLASTELFFRDRGLPEHYTHMAIDGDRETTVVSDDPLTVRVDITYAGDTIRHVIDEDLDVVEWDVFE